MIAAAANNMAANPLTTIPRPPRETRRRNESYTKAPRVLDSTATPPTTKDGGNVRRPETTGVKSTKTNLTPIQQAKRGKRRSSSRTRGSSVTRKNKSAATPLPQQSYQQPTVKEPKQRVTRCKPEKSHKKRTVGHYVVGETIGEGTFGKVRRGVHLLTGETVAIKVLEKSKIKTEADLTRVTREIKILKKTRHENCIRLLEVIDTPQQIFLMMEYLDGGELFDYIVEKSRIPEREASQLFSQILDGVEYLHKTFISHRDLKPENLLMKKHSSGKFTVKVCDFGLSNTFDGNVLLRTACGSPCYASPEMIAGKRYDGGKSDIWSLGVVLFALVCGYLPFEDNDTPTLYRKILTADYRCPGFVSPPVKDLLARILDTNPLSRISISEIRSHIWMRKYNGFRGLGTNQSSCSMVPDEEDSGEITDASPDAEDLDIDERVMDALEEAGLDRDAILKGLRAGSHNSATASYFLISQRFARAESADSSSQENTEKALSNRKVEQLLDVETKEVETVVTPGPLEGTSDTTETNPTEGEDKNTAMQPQQQQQNTNADTPPAAEKEGQQVLVPVVPAKDVGASASTRPAAILENRIKPFVPLSIKNPKMKPERPKESALFSTINGKKPGTGTKLAPIGMPSLK